MFTTEEKISTLKNTNFFKNWDDKFLKTIADNSNIDSYKENVIIFDQNQLGDRLYIILKGCIVILSPEDKTVIAEFVKGEMFGEAAIITGKPQNAIARTEEQSYILSFPKNGEPISEALKNSPETYANLLKSFLITVSKRTRKANSLIKENSPIMQELQQQVYADKLTGLLNKAYLEENISKFMKSDFSLIMMKPDNFKIINDNFGHEKGDECLTFIGSHLSQFLDTNSILVRYQGNEFAILTPQNNKRKAEILAKKVKDELENLDISPIIENDLKLSMSLGILLYPDTKISDNDFIKVCSEIPLIGRSQGGSKILFEGDF